MASSQEALRSLPEKQRQLLLHPTHGITDDFKRIYQFDDITVGWPQGEPGRFDHLARPHTAGIVGAGFGDEGKARGADNKIREMLSRRAVKRAYMIRYQGGNNSGHTLQHERKRLALHVIPAVPFEERATGIIDRGMTLHLEDLRTEYEYVESELGQGVLDGRLLVSIEAKVCTDIERAEEVLNRERSGAAKGGTGRGMAPTEARSISRTGLKLHHIMADDWATRLANYYDDAEKMFAGFGRQLAEMPVPDYQQTLVTGNDEKRTVGSREAFMDRIAQARLWLIHKEMVVNTAPLHQEIFQDSGIGVIFEGAQAIGLHVSLGSQPDVTCTDTSLYGIASGTGFWKPEQVRERYAVFKGSYESSVGERKPLTLMDDAHASRIREFAHEYGTTTGRPRDILHVDLARMTYNLDKSGAEALIATHVDVSWEDTPVKVATHYTNKEGEVVLYQPGLLFQEELTPQYAELPGWSADDVQKAKSFEELPVNARRFLAFIQARTGYPIVAASTGPDRSNFITTQGFSR